MKNYELPITNYEMKAVKIFAAFCLLVASVFCAAAQSINQSFPTPITANEISGRIAARDIGDARLTGYFYTFEGKQGDVFINVVTTNFNGDIDIFTAGDLRPLAKITAYADSSNNETGRVVYLRQSLKLILRIEGRTPNDDAATFQIKFAGSFSPSTEIAGTDGTPAVKSNNQTDVRVNSVGTIIETKPKPTPTPKEVIAKVEKPVKEKKPKTSAEKKGKSKADESASEKIIAPPKETVAQTETKDKITEQSVVENVAKKEESQSLPVEPKAEESAVEAKEPPPESKPPVKPVGKTKELKEKKKSNVLKPVASSELANINLIILFKDGTKIERPMSEVLKFGVDKGILTVITKDGTIGRYSILEVEKMTIE